MDGSTTFFSPRTFSLPRSIQSWRKGGDLGEKINFYVCRRGGCPNLENGKRRSAVLQFDDAFASERQ